MFRQFQQLTGTNLAIGIVNIAFLAAAGTVCWRSWESDGGLERDLVDAAPQETTESPPIPQMVSATFTMDTAMQVNANGNGDERRSPTGTWRRISEPAKITLQFDQQTVSGLYQTDQDGRELLVSFMGDYRVGGENLLYGVIQEAGVRSSQGPSSTGAGFTSVVMPHDASRLIDQPFSARYELSESGLMIRDVKFAGSGLRELEQPLERVFSHFVGGYARVPERG